jgi:hypothetical protein
MYDSHLGYDSIRINVDPEQESSKTQDHAESDGEKHVVYSERQKKEFKGSRTNKYNRCHS